MIGRKRASYVNAEVRHQNKHFGRFVPSHLNFRNHSVMDHLGNPCSWDEPDCQQRREPEDLEKDCACIGAVLDIDQHPVL